MGRARYLGLTRNHARFMLMGFAYNLKRAFTIQTACQLTTKCGINPSHRYKIAKITEKHALN